jgi:dipeptidase E
MNRVKLLLASTSTIYGGTYLDYLEESIQKHFEASKNIVFIPFARPGGISHEGYSAIACRKFNSLGLKIQGLDGSKEAIKTLKKADGVFVGGGNSFVLLKALYDLNLIETLKSKILDGMPYMGSSAGSNLAGLTIGTSNDMPIVYPPSFDALGAIHFNINPHYFDPMEGSKHMGETRETRIKEFHHYNEQAVLGLREGSWLQVSEGRILLKGDFKARLFRKEMEAIELPAGDLIRI